MERLWQGVKARRPACGRRSSGAATAVAVAMSALLGVNPEPAAAGSYRVLACDAAPGAAHNSWRERDQRGMLAAALCPSRGDLRRGLVVRNRVSAGRVRHRRGAFMTFRAPAGAWLAAIDLAWHGRRTTAGWRLGLVRGDGRLLAGCSPARHAGSPACRLGGPKGSGRVRRGLGGARRVRLEASCGVPRGCDTAPPGMRGERTRARLAVQRAIVTVADGSDPNLEAAGDMLDGRWRRGEAGTLLRAADNVGVRVTALRVDGATLDTHRSSCDYTRPVPCPRAVGRAYRLDTRRLADGEHRLALTALDTAGNMRSREELIRVDNTAPGRVRGVRVLGRSGIRSRNRFDLRWTPPAGQAAPIARVRYRLCRRGTVERCTSGSRDGGATGVDGLTVPGRGAWRFRAWLEDAAGNASAATASAPVTLRFDDRAPTRLRAGIAPVGATATRRATVDFGSRPELRGFLRGRGRGVGRGRLIVTTRVRGSSHHRRVGVTTTSPAGRYRFRLPAGPSRTVTVLFRGNAQQRPTSARARLAVRAGSSIEVSRRRVADGDRVRFRGRLGGPVPRNGKLVQLEAHYRGRWRTFAVVRSDARGRWRRPYRFGGTSGRVVYPFRARIPREARYPYAVGHSRVVRVTVAGG